MLENLWLILLFPLLGALVCGLLGRRLSERTVGAIGCTAILLSFAVSLGAWLELLQLAPEDYPGTQVLFTWIEAGRFSAEFSLLFDPLSALMILIVTGVSFLIHLYSMGYMKGESGYSRYFCYLNLFVLMMSLLVLAGNYLLMFVGWKGVGLCSYLLIGYYISRRSAGDAAKKAFIVNRIGDVGFLLGVFLIFATFESVDFEDVFAQAGNGTGAVLTAITLLLFVGAIGKSAQIPLYVWLPDAMEGPTPVSALIHAATMVTAGVYMIARSAPLYVQAPLTLGVIAVVGLFTAVLAALIALVQKDIKKVLAYSTVSQLGYMFLALGVGAFGAAVFHLLTHAFFKALLFLGAGSVIHAMHHEQDMFKMGGLRRHLPVTYWTMLIGAMAISGVPLLSGFFSKDEILWRSYSSGSWMLWLPGVLVAGLTAFYIFRLIFLTFHGTENWQDHAPEKERTPPRESPWVMTLPLVVLMILSIGAGWLGLPAWLPFPNFLEHFLAPSLVTHGVAAGTGHGHGLEIALTLVTSILALGAIGLAVWFYLRNPGVPVLLSRRFPGIYRLLEGRFFVDELYDALVVHPVRRVSQRLLWRWMDLEVIDGAVNGIAQMMLSGSGLVRLWQNGLVRSYAAWIVTGVSLALLFFLVSF